MKTTPTTETLWRDDDVNYLTDAFRFRELHERFVQRGQIHTAAVLMKDLWENHALFYYLVTAPNLDIGLHGWTHKDYSKLSYEECYEDIKRSLDYWGENTQRMVGKTKPIGVFFAPWNKESKEIKKACEDLDLKFCATKGGEWDGKKVKSFHHWAVINGHYPL